MDNVNQSFTSVRKEVSYMDVEGKRVQPEKAVKVLVKEYDEHDKLIQTKMTIDFAKINVPGRWFFNVAKGQFF
ncbi:hypothetical protein [Sporomusa sp. KB1]|jgi:hypothetical protein|uniref:hypothetical protein n=1 Tax=Sporomusa sp. KB1 TaxID=943346 RepID=UPI0011A5DB78|nr:hypothetical protein [Sporomusa sp. KB1]TWH44963.1 hypothetical protein Salpa_0842 [Sporomusa sp. KB1]